jgi:two-component system, chemotaxis family, chemotaxis protein CheY
MLAALQGSQDLRGTAQLKPAKNRPPAMSPKLSKKELGDRIQALCVLVVDDNQYMRKTIRNLLVNCGVKDICEAADGIAALDTLRTVGPDVVLLDWEMPLLNGAELVRIVRSPGVFPMPHVPIIMLSGHGERWRVLEAMRLGVNEYLIKPVSAKAIYAGWFQSRCNGARRSASETTTSPSRAGSPAKASRT